MRLDHEFTVSAPIERVWQAVLDPERVAPCMPGATLTEVDGDTFKGSVKVKLGPVNLQYKGSGEFQEKDEQARKLVIQASGKDARGAGTASALVTVTLTPEGDGTKGAVATDLNVTGRPAQFGRGMISDVGGKILTSFADSLAGELGASTAPAAESTSAGSTAAGSTAAESTVGPAAAEPTHAAPSAGAAAEQQPGRESTAGKRPGLHAASDAPEGGAIDLMEYAGSSVAKRLLPVLAGLAALGGVIAAIGLRRRKRG